MVSWFDSLIPTRARVVMRLHEVRIESLGSALVASVHVVYNTKITNW